MSYQSNPILSYQCIPHSSSLYYIFVRFKTQTHIRTVVTDFNELLYCFCSESHRGSHNSQDENAITPLNETETQSCSSSGSHDWRLDLRGNNLDRSPPPPVTTSITEEGLAELNNQLNYESKFVDSQSDHSSSTNKEGHFNRLIMSDSVYGKIYKTQRMPNGLETTEV